LFEDICLDQDTLDRIAAHGTEANVGDETNLLSGNPDFGSLENSCCIGRSDVDLYGFPVKGAYTREQKNRDDKREQYRGCGKTNFEVAPVDSGCHFVKGTLSNRYPLTTATGYQLPATSYQLPATNMRRIITASFICFIVFTRVAAAQVRTAGDVDPLGRVLAKVIAGMTEPGALSHPVSGLRVIVVGEKGDSTTMLTDDAGIATAWLPPGTYRFVTPDTINWQGRAYKWDIVVPIRPGSPAIRFSQATATTDASAVASPVTAAAPIPPAPVAETSQSASPRLRVFIDCQVNGCDMDFFRTEIPFVDYMRDRKDASVHILVTSQSTGGGGAAYTLNFIGLRELTSLADTLHYQSPQSSTEDQIRHGLANAIKLGLVRYVTHVSSNPQLEVTYKPAVVQASTAPTKDPWNLWVFQINANGNFSGEESQHFTNLRGSTNANRTSEVWKLRFSVYGDYNESKFTFSDGSKFASYTHSYSASHLLAKSLGSHFSVGERASVSASSFLNEKLYLRFAPVVEYNIFPYSESTRRLFTIQYAIGINSFRYEDTTIFEKIEEVRPDQTVTLSLDLKQPWGTVSTSLEGAAYLDDFSKRRANLFNSLSVRLFKGFNVNGYLGVSLLRDQIYLAKGALSDEDILVRQRQLASSYSYFAGIGLSYTFGSIFNNVVNPRFEGASGGTFFF